MSFVYRTLERNGLSFDRRGNKIFEPPRYMSINTAVSQLLEVEETRNAGILTGDRTLAIAMSRVGSDEQKIVCGTLEELSAQSQETFGSPLHSLVIVGRRLHHLEVEYAEQFAIDKSNWRKVAKEVYGCSLEDES